MRLIVGPVRAARNIRNRSAAAWMLVALAGCSPASWTWHRDLDPAKAEAARRDRPLLVLSLLGDLEKRC